MKIADLSRSSGLTAHTIRYYERIGLMPYAARNDAGHRDYGAETLTWITFIGHMKAAGMPIAEMLRYALLRKQGDARAPQRAAMLRTRRDQVARQIAALNDTLSVLDAKIDTYDRQEKTDDDIR